MPTRTYKLSILNDEEFSQLVKRAHCGQVSLISKRLGDDKTTVLIIEPSYKHLWPRIKRDINSIPGDVIYSSDAGHAIDEIIAKHENLPPLTSIRNYGRELSSYLKPYRRMSNYTIAVDLEEGIAHQVKGTRVIRFDKKFLVYSTDCGRIYQTSFEKDPNHKGSHDDGRFICPKVFNDVKDVCVIEFDKWLVLFNNGKLVKFRFNFGNLDEPIVVGKLGRIKHLFHLNYDSSRENVGVLDYDNDIITIHTPLMKVIGNELECEYGSYSLDDQILMMKSAEIEDFNMFISESLGSESDIKVLKSSVIVNDEYIYHVGKIPESSDFSSESWRAMVEADPNLVAKAICSVNATKRRIGNLNVKDAILLNSNTFVISDEGELHCKNSNSNRSIKIDLGLKLNEFIYVDGDLIIFNDTRHRIYGYQTRDYDLKEILAI